MVSHKHDPRMSRVSMDWPIAFKERVRKRTGRRGLTQFTIDAVEEYLDGGQKGLLAELDQAQRLAQKLADILATVVDYETRLNQLGQLRLPDWIDQRSWPNAVLERTQADLLNEVEEPAAPPDAPDMQRIGEFTTQRLEEQAKPVSEPEPEQDPVDPPVDLPHDQSAGDNLFERLKSAGVLQPASALSTPAQRSPEPAPTPTRTQTKTRRKNDVKKKAPASTPAPTAASTPPFPAAPDDTCPECGSELVMGECWTVGCPGVNG